MKNYRTLASFLLTGLLLFSLASCNKGTSVEKIDQRFTNYIAGFTSGVISNSSSIRIKLYESLISSDQVNSPIDERLFKFSPKIDGQAFWIDSRTIEFRPEETLPSDQEYSASFFLSKLIDDVPSAVKTMDFTFKTKIQYLTVDLNGIRPYSNNNLKLQMLEGELRTSDYADVEAIENLLNASQNGKKMGISWRHDSEQHIHSFTIDSLDRTESEQQVKVSWNGDAISSEDKDELDFTIPSLSDFSVMDVQVLHSPNQYVSIRFSDPVDETQNLTGLVSIDNGYVYGRIELDGNELKIFPENTLQGEIEIDVNSGIRNVAGYNLKNNYERTLVFESIKPEVKLVGDGVILPGTDGLIFPFKAVNLEAVNVQILKIYQENVQQFLQVNRLDQTNELNRVAKEVYNESVELEANRPVDFGKWNTFSLDLSQMIQSEPGALYRVILSFEKKHALYPCENDEDEDELEVLYEEDSYEEDYYYYDDYDYYYYDPEFRWSEKDDPCKKSYYIWSERTVARNILATNLGIIAKSGDNKELHVAVTDIRTTDQITGAEIEVYDYQRQLIASTTTDGKGEAVLTLDDRAYLIVAKQEDQFGYLRVDDGSSLSLSMFDVGGAKTKKGVKGYLYGERGVWRPGDSIYLSFILEDKNEVIPESHPVVLELYDPQNQLYQRTVTSNGVDGLYAFRLATDQDAPTGNWLAKAKVGMSSFTKTVKIEAIKPNRLKIKLDFPDDVISAKASDRSVNLSSTWLHGAIAGNLNADVEITYKSKPAGFDKYPGFVFNDPASEFSPYTDMIYEGVLTADGKANFNYPSSVSNAPGMLEASFKCRVFEKSGDFSTYRFSKPYSPYDGYTGVKIPEGTGWRGSWMNNEKLVVPIMTVDENGKPVNSNNVSVKVYKIEWRWWWERNSEESLSRYATGSGYSAVKSSNIRTVDGKGIFEMEFGEWDYGRYLIRVTDHNTGHSTGDIIYVDWPYWKDRNNTESPGGATMLTFKTDKEKYEVGESVDVTFASSSGSKAFISIENGSRVLMTDWAQTSDESTTYTFQVTEEMAPNFYLHITLLQPHNQVKNDLPIRMYGVQPVMVEDPETHLTPVISMPKTLEPLQEYVIEVEEDKGKAMSYTLAVVDEGLLDITGYRTPKPWNHFYARDALGIKTWDMFDLVIGAFTGEMAGLLALGGDGDITPKEGSKVNRFKPVVTYLGPFSLKKNGKNKHSIQMPYYVGSVKTMVIAAKDGAYGSSDVVTPVKKPLMVLATMPRVVGPDEKVKLPVTVFAMDKKIKNVAVEIQTNGMLSIVGEKKKNISFSQEGDQIVTFDLSALPKTGVANLKVIAKGSGEEAKDEIELEVRVPNPKVNKVYEAALSAGESWNQQFMPIGIEGTNEGVIEISSIPPLNLENRLQYLIRYPHGCIEQTTSSVFPQLHIKNLLDLDDDQKSKIQSNVNAGIQRLRKFQLTNGGMSYWPGNSEYASEWGTNYAGHFMLEAKAAGYSLPVGFLKNWTKFQTREANNWSRGTRNSDALIQAYRLYTLALAGKPALGAMNRMKEMNDLDDQAIWRLGAAYAVMGKTDVAKKIIKKTSTQIPKYRELSYSFGSSERDMAMILETFTYLDDKVEGSKIMKQIADEMGSNRWYSTQTTAYSLLAIAKFVGQTSEEKGLKFSYELDNSKKTSVSSDQPIKQIPLEIGAVSERTALVKNESSQMIFVRMQLSGNPLQGEELDESNGLSMSVDYKDADGRSIDVGSLLQGSDFRAIVKVTNTSNYKQYKELALSQVFPSGWEIGNARLDGTTEVNEQQFKYQDIRDDRVYTYFDLLPNRSKTFTVNLNASYLGEFYLPAVYCEAMYDNEINALRKGKWVSVIEPADN